MVKTKEILKNQGLTIYDIKKKTNQLERDVLNIMQNQREMVTRCEEIKGLITRKKLNPIGKMVCICVDFSHLRKAIEGKQYKNFIKGIKEELEFQSTISRNIHIRPFKITYNYRTKLATFTCDVIDNEENDLSLLDAIEINI